MPSFNPSVPYFSERLQMRPPVMADLERSTPSLAIRKPTLPPRRPAHQRGAGRFGAAGAARRLAATRLRLWRSPCANGRIGLSGLAGCPETARRAARTVNLGYRFDTRVWGMGWPRDGAGFTTGLSGWGWVRFPPLCARRIRLRGGCWKRLACSVWIRWMTCPAAPSLVYTLKRGDYQG
ncbi:GNAT family N-acetyltransferase [Serratia ureilytica]